VSRSPTESTKRDFVSTDFRDAETELLKLVRAGYSFSGHERNCAFLNTGGNDFANVSGVSGFDFDDDGRSLALVDWDHDGDLDVWTANRTGPMLRFLRNDAVADSHYVAVRLQGTTSNRDAIGARVELTLENQPGQKLVKTLRAGEGFLGQSSKWLHFGLGSGTRVEQLSVRWPNGGVERFANLAADHRYRIVEGSGQVEPWSAPAGRVPLKQVAGARPASPSNAGTLLTSRIPPVPLEWSGRDATTTRLADHAGHPVLVNVWASWCGPCATELGELTREQRDLQAAGLRIVALSVDKLDDATGDPQAEEKVLEKIGFPFDSGFATTQLIDKLQALHDTILRPHRPLPVPSSFLFDDRGRLAAIYLGPITPAQVLADVGALTLDGDALLQTALPFPGRRYAPLGRTRLLNLALKLTNQGFLQDAMTFVHDNERHLIEDADIATLYFRFGKELLDRDEKEAAIEQFRKALAVAPDDARSYYNLGVALQAEGQPEAAIHHLQEAIRTDPEYAKAYVNLAVLLASRGDVEVAEAHLREALRIDPGLANAHSSLAKILVSQHKFPDAIRHYREALVADPQNAEVVNSLGVALRFHGKSDEAVVQFREALRIDPEMADAHNNLATELHARGNTAEAMGHLRKALKIRPEFVQAHGNLAIALLASRKHEEAIEHFREVVRLAPRSEQAIINLGKALTMLGRPEEAIESFRQAVALNPQSSAAHVRLGFSLSAQGETTAAIHHLRKAIELRPEMLEPRIALAWMLATHSDPEIRNPEEALALARQNAIETAHRNPRVLDVLAAAYAANLQWDEAEQTAQAALDALTPQQRGRFEAIIEQRLELYRQRQPYIQPVE